MKHGRAEPERGPVIARVLAVTALLFGPTPAPAQGPEDLPPPARLLRDAPVAAPMPLRGAPPDQPISKLLAKRWTVEDGLPTDSLLDATRTRDGFLWITSYEGLVRFDGIRFETLNQEAHPRLTTDTFIGLHEDDAGVLWIGTQGSGIWQMVDGELRPYWLDPPGVVSMSLLLENADIWIGMDTGLFRRSTGAEGFEKILRPGLDAPRVRGLVMDDQGVIWIGAEGEGLGRLEGSSFRWLTMEDGLPGPEVTSLDYHRGRLWIGTRHGLGVLDEKGLRAVEGTRGHEINSARVDDHGNVWMTSNRGLLRYHADTGDVEVAREIGGVPLQGLYQVTFDHEQNIWLTSVVGGLIRLRPSLFETVTRRDGLSTDRISAVLEEDSGELLIGTEDGKVQRWSDGRLTDLVTPTPLPAVRVRGMIRDRQGRLWVVSYAGLTRITENEILRLTTEDGLPTDQVRWIYEDARGRLWLATRSAGLVYLEPPGADPPRRFEPHVFDEDDGLPSSFVFSVEEIAPDRLALATRGGLALVDVAEDPTSAHGFRARSFRDPEDLPSPVIFNVLADPPPEKDATETVEDRLWLATDGGLGRMEGERFFQIRRRDGLPVDTIFDLHRDARGILWMSSPVGVLRVPESDLTAYLAGGGPRPRFRVLDTEDGLPHRQCTAAVPFLRGAGDRMVFPTLGGVAILDPDSYAPNPVPLPVLIREVRVDGERLDRASRLEIDPSAKRVVFSFAGPTFVRPSKAQLWYHLEGFDDRWTQAGEERQAGYTNLDPGTYRFHVVGANSDGLWNLEGDTQEVVLRPGFLESPWTLGILALCLALAVQQVVSWRLDVVRRRNRNLQEIIDRQRLTAAENQALIRELEHKNHEIEARSEELERFTYTISHDLKSPLVTIRGFVGALQEDIAEGDQERIDEDVRLILSASERMQRLLSEILNLSRIGRVHEPPEEISMTELAWEAVALTAGHAQASDAQIDVQIDMPVLRVDRSRMVEVFQNLIENALKFTDPDRRPEIHVGCEPDGDETVFFVRDNGIGIAPEHQEQIFGLFKRLSPDVEGTGAGLAIVKRTVEAHGGHIWVESDGEGKGSCFRLTVAGPPAERDEP